MSAANGRNRSDPGSRDDPDPRSGALPVQRFVVVGYILAVAMPPLGFALGIVLTLRAPVRSRHGPWIVLVSIAGAAIWALLISAGALTANNQSY